MDSIVNKVASSGLITLDLAEWLPKEDEIEELDIKQFLFRELIIKEKDFREQLAAFNWQQYAHKHVAIYCSVEAIIPQWAFMLLATYLQPVAKSIFNGDKASLMNSLLLQSIKEINVTEYADKRVVIKGCGDKDVPTSAYIFITAKLQPVVKSIMFGEPCSTVPIYKRK